MYPALTIIFFITTSLQGTGGPEQWSNTKSYTHTTAVLDANGDTYLTVQNVSPGILLSNTDYWTLIDEAVPKEEPEGQDLLEAPNLSTLPNYTPDGVETDGSGGGGIDSSAIQIFSLSTRTAIYGNDISASLNMGGDANTPKKVMFRVKGPSMNFNGAKLANPWMDVWTRSNVQGSQWSQMFSSYDFGDHDSSSEYEDRSTGNPVEPLVVESITPSIVSCVVNSETVGGTGNANVEVYSLDDDNTTSYFKSLSTRGYVTTDTMIGSLRLVGTGTKDIMFRVKGPSMNFSGSKLTDPNLAIYHKENDWAEIVKSSTFQQYDSQDSSYTNVTSSYTDRHTGNNLEPLVVYRLSAGTYSCVVSSDIANEEGSANLEIYDVSE